MTFLPHFGTYISGVFFIAHALQIIGVRRGCVRGGPIRRVDVDGLAIYTFPEGGTFVIGESIEEGFTKCSVGIDRRGGWNGGVGLGPARRAVAAMMVATVTMRGSVAFWL